MATRPAKSEHQAIADHYPWKPPAFDNADAAAIQALGTGSASSAQQKRALDWIITKAAGTYDFPYRPGGVEGERDTAIALGRMFVGQQIVKLLKIKIGLLRRES
jgi:hypothetical protein